MYEYCEQYCVLFFLFFGHSTVSFCRVPGLSLTWKKWKGKSEAEAFVPYVFVLPLRSASLRPDLGEYCIPAQRTHDDVTQSDSFWLCPRLWIQSRLLFLSYLLRWPIHDPGAAKVRQDVLGRRVVGDAARAAAETEALGAELGP